MFLWSIFLRIGGNQMKLAIVGQPGIGKTTLSHILEFQFPNQVILVPDKLDLIDKDLMPTAKNNSGHKIYQKALFLFQRELEDLVCSGAEDKLVICDGSALDVLRYWPGTAESFFDEVHTTLKDELMRYDWVLQIFSTFGEIDLQAKKNIWYQHTRYLSISKDNEFNLCAQKASKILSQILNDVPYHKILESSAETYCNYQSKQNIL